MSCIDKNQFKKPLGVHTVRYPLPDYGEDAYVCVRSLTLADIRRLESKYGKGEKDTEQNTAYTFDLLASALVDDAGQVLFADGAEASEDLNVTITAFKSLVDFVIDTSGLGTPSKN